MDNKLLSGELVDIILSARSTEYGRYWPREYTEFFSSWGYFNRIYDLLYRGNEWEKIASFSLDGKFLHIWDMLRRENSVLVIAQAPCVGNGKFEYQPSIYSRVASHTLRVSLDFDLAEICKGWKCEQRSQRGWQLCQDFIWPELPEDMTTPQAAKYTPLGALLTIIYQIRNNLFHGAKHEYDGPEYERNLMLVASSNKIMKIILTEILEVFGVKDA